MPSALRKRGQLSSVKPSACTNSCCHTTRSAKMQLGTGHPGDVRKKAGCATHHCCAQLIRPRARGRVERVRAKIGVAEDGTVVLIAVARCGIRERATGAGRSLHCAQKHHKVCVRAGTGGGLRAACARILGGIGEAGGADSQCAEERVGDRILSASVGQSARRRRCRLPTHISSSVRRLART